LLGAFGGRFGLPVAFLVSAGITTLTVDVALLPWKGRTEPRG
jgi:hypothetical protein